ncbi:DUF6491 family protein [Xanthomonadaceae bacterium XH05]|nr:DUF6491 family protein [Xanthomonadaceae bacterium XH05]
MLRKTIATAAVAALTLAGCAAQDRVARSDTARDCFSATSVRGFTPLDDTTVRLQVGMRDTYELKTFGVCPGVDWSQSIGLRTRSGASWICTRDAMNVEIILNDRTVPVGQERCRVHSIRKVDQVELDTEKAREAELRAARKASRR